jgi:hypothetical protein
VLSRLRMPAKAGVVRRVLRAAGYALVVNACRATAAAGIATTIVWTSGCYSYLPSNPSEVNPNSHVTATITDVGRVALGQRVGEEVAAIEGTVTQRQDTSFQLMVTQVRFLNGLSNQWQGQEITLRQQDVRSLTTKTFSKRRTIVFALAAAAGAVLTILSLNFLGIISGDPGIDKIPPPPPEV